VCQPGTAPRGCKYYCASVGCDISPLASQLCIPTVRFYKVVTGLDKHHSFMSSPGLSYHLLADRGI
jgi:hypothetical protein